MHSAQSSIDTPDEVWFVNIKTAKSGANQILASPEQLSVE
jgi:hypothetical protein